MPLSPPDQAAILISPPANPLALAGIMGSAAPTGLRRYIGSYQTSAIEVLQIRLRNGQLTAVYPGMKPQALTRTSGQEFRIGNTNAYIQLWSGTSVATGVITDRRSDLGFRWALRALRERGVAQCLHSGWRDSCCSRTRGRVAGRLPP